MRASHAHQTSTWDERRYNRITIHGASHGCNFARLSLFSVEKGSNRTKRKPKICLPRARKIHETRSVRSRQWFWSRVWQKCNLSTFFFCRDFSGKGKRIRNREDRGWKISLFEKFESLSVVNCFVAVSSMVMIVKNVKHNKKNWLWTEKNGKIMIRSEI